MREIEWENPNKMKIDTGHKTFDRQTNLIAEGNINANTMAGRYIRAWSDTEGRKGVEPGELWRYDWSYWDSFNVPEHIKEDVYLHTKDKGGIFYAFFHYNGKKRIVHGFILCDRQHTCLKDWTTGPTEKSYRVIAVCAGYVSTVYDQYYEEKQ